MKKTALTAALAAAIGVLSLPYAALASKGVQPIQVVLETGSPLKFEAEPFIDAGNTLVQFRTIFEGLGLEVSWEPGTRTVRGTGDSLEITLQIGSKKAIVNGVAHELEAAPRIVNDVTFVPVRFAGEALGRQVGWDGYNRTVMIGSMEQQAAYTISKALEYSADENLEAYMSYYNPSDPNFAVVQQAIAGQMAAYDFDIALQSLKVLEQPDEDHAVVQYSKSIRKLSGPDYADNTMTTQVQLIRIDGSWKLGPLEIPLKLEYDLPQELTKDHNPKVSAADERELLAALGQYADAQGEEQLEDLKDMYDPAYPNLEAVLQETAQVWAVADYRFTVENASILEFKEGKAILRYTLYAERVKGPDSYPSMKVDNVDTWQKDSAGKWRLLGDAAASVEYLH